MKFKYKKGFQHKDCMVVDEKIKEFIDRKVGPGFYSKYHGHYMDKLQKDYTIDVIIKEKK